MNDDELARIRNEEIGFVFQTFNLLPRATALHNVELPLVYAGVSAKDRQERAMQALEKVELTSRVDAPAERAVRRPAPARRDRARPREQPLDPARRRADREPRLEDRRGNHGGVQRLHEAGNTIILVTHEADIAAHAHRVIYVRDGQVEKDVAGSAALHGAWLPTQNVHFGDEVHGRRRRSKVWAIVSCEVASCDREPRATPQPTQHRSSADDPQSDGSDRADALRAAPIEEARASAPRVAKSAAPGHAPVAARNQLRSRAPAPCPARRAASRRCASRMPNSRVRCATDWLMTAKTPLAASSSVRIANAPSISRQHRARRRRSRECRLVARARPAAPAPAPGGVAPAAAIARRARCGSVETPREDDRPPATPTARRARRHPPAESGRPAPARRNRSRRGRCR